MATDRGCTLKTCIDPDEVGCNRGFLLEDCAHRKQALQTRGNGIVESAAAAPTGSDVADSERHQRLPWTGNSLGVLDLDLVTATNRTTLIGVVGPYNAGKTTLLTLIYLVMQHGEQLPACQFSGSTTLIGWENLAAKLRWLPGEGGPKFPPHTSRGAGRRPGLLHLTIRGQDHVRRDFLLTDPPGEWFNAWALKEQSDGAQGARWVQKYADRFIFLVDREALAQPERGKARGAFMDLARRLSTGLDGRQVAVVWTKSDKPISPIIEEDLRACFATELPNHAEFHVRVRFGDEPRSEVEDPCLGLMYWMFAPDSTPAAKPLNLPVSDDSDLFFAYRGQAVRS